MESMNSSRSEDISYSAFSVQYSYIFLSENVAVLRPTVPIPEEVDVQNKLWPNSNSRNKAVHFTNSLDEKIAEDDPEN